VNNAAQIGMILEQGRGKRKEKANEMK